jgi:hypothetical protein
MKHGDWMIFWKFAVCFLKPSKQIQRNVAEKKYSQKVENIFNPSQEYCKERLHNKDKELDCCQKTSEKKFPDSYNE